MTAPSRADLVRVAEVDPWAQHAQLHSGDPAQIEDLAAAFYRAAGDTADAAVAHRRAAQYVRRGYLVRGASPLDTSAVVRTTSAGLRDAEHYLPAIAKTLVGVADELAGATRCVDFDLQTLEQQLAIVDAGLASFQHDTGHHLAPTERQQVVDAYFRQAVEHVRATGRSTTKAVFGYEHVLHRATSMLTGLGFHSPVGLRDAGEVTAVALPVGTAPASVSRWWRTLTPAQQEYLIDHRYGTLGRLKGLPAAVLDAANRHRLGDDIARLKVVLAGAVTGSAVTVAATKRLAEDRGVLRGLAHRDVDGTAPAAYLLAYDPGAPRGQTGVVMSYGDPDSADDVAVVVPGAQSHAGDLDTPASHGINVYDGMTSPSKAVVVWLNGPEPQSIFPQGAEDGFADESAPRLVDDIAALRATHAQTTGGHGHLTLVGHSYGSYIAGKAMTHGADADDVVFLGSPGVGVNHATDLGIDPHHVWDGQTGDDPILLVRNRFTPGATGGNNPADSGFGGMHFSVDGAHGHQQYYDDDSESVRNVGHIADGDYAEVDRVPAPDYRGPRELPSDLEKALVTPYSSGWQSAKAALDGNVTGAASSAYNGLADEGHAVLDTVSDCLGL